MKQAQPVHIVVATDSNYLIHTQTLLKSIEDNHIGDVVVHVLAFNLSAENCNDIRSTVKGYDYVFYPVSDSDIQKRLFSRCSKLHKDRSLAAFARLLIPELLPDDIERCLYLDVDGIVLRDLAKLMTTSLEGFAAAGVLDTNPQRRHSAVGLTPDMTYINTGVILWNLPLCRQINIVDRFEEFVTQHNGVVDAMDQGTFNGAISQYIKVLPPIDALTSFFQLTSRQIQQLYGVKTYTDRELSKAKTEPVFVHFTPNMTTRPWVKNCRHPLRDLYWKYRLKVNPEFILSPDLRSFKLKLLSWLFYHLSWPIFLKIVKR